MVRGWTARVAVAVIVVAPVTCAMAQPQASPTVTVAATRTGSTGLILPAPVSLTVTAGLSSPDVKITGKGRIIGVALRPMAPPHSMPVLVAAQMQSCYEVGCTGRYKVQFISGSAVDHPGRIVIPRGRYVLQAFTDGSPISVSLALHGIARRLTLKATRPASFTVESPTPTLTGVAVTPGITVAPSHHTIQHPGIEALVFGQIDWQAAVGGDLTACFYNNDLPVIAPECPGGTGIVADGVFVDPAAGTQLMYADYSSSADVGPATGGLALAHASVARFIASNVAWLES